jgi:hypothetical protein
MSAKWLDHTFSVAHGSPEEGGLRIAFVLMYFAHFLPIPHWVGPITHPLAVMERAMFPLRREYSKAFICAGNGEKVTRHASRLEGLATQIIGMCVRPSCD